MSEKEGLPRAVFLARGEAERWSAAKNIESFRQVLPFDFEAFIISPPWPTNEELEVRVGEILGMPFRMPTELAGGMAGDDRLPIFPKSATNEQMARIVGLFELTFFHVEEAVVAPSSPGIAETRDRA